MIRKIASRLTQLTALAAVFLPLSSQALTIDQSINMGANQVQYFAPVGQSFYASDANIGSVGLFINPFNTFFNDPTLEMALFSGAGDFSNGAKLVSNTFNLGSSFSDWLYLDVSGVNFVAGNNYTIGVFNDSPQWGVSVAGGDVYANGTGYFFGSPTYTDLTFRVLPESSVPEPSAFILTAMGLLLLGAARRKA